MCDGFALQRLAHLQGVAGEGEESNQSPRTFSGCEKAEMRKSTCAGLKEGKGGEHQNGEQGRWEGGEREPTHWVQVAPARTPLSLKLISLSQYRCRFS